MCHHNFLHETLDILSARTVSSQSATGLFGQALCGGVSRSWRSEGHNQHTEQRAQRPLNNQNQQAWGR